MKRTTIISEIRQFQVGETVSASLLAAAMDMADQSQSCSVQLSNGAGLHLRAANLFVQEAAKYESQIEVEKDSQRVDGKSIMSLLMLGAVSGSELRILATGNDADVALAALADLVAHKFYEGEQEQT